MDQPGHFFIEVGGIPIDFAVEARHKAIQGGKWGCDDFSHFSSPFAIYQKTGNYSGGGAGARGALAKSPFFQRPPQAAREGNLNRYENRESIAQWGRSRL